MLEQSQIELIFIYYNTTYVRQNAYCMIRYESNIMCMGYRMDITNVCYTNRLYNHTMEQDNAIAYILLGTIRNMQSSSIFCMSQSIVVIILNFIT